MFSIDSTAKNKKELNNKLNKLRSAPSGAQPLLMYGDWIIRRSEFASMMVQAGVPTALLVGRAETVVGTRLAREKGG